MAAALRDLFALTLHWWSAAQTVAEPEAPGEETGGLAPEALDAIDHDTLAAVRTRWLASGALPGLINSPPQAGRLVAQHGAVYVVITSQLERRELTGTRRTWFDWRRVTITAYGPEADVREIAEAALDVFNLDVSLVFPSGARFVKWWPEGNTLELDEENAQAEDIWRAEVAGLVLAVRAR